MVKCLWVICSSQVARLVAFRMAYSPQSLTLLPSTFLTVDIYRTGITRRNRYRKPDTYYTIPPLGWLLMSISIGDSCSPPTG